MAGLRLVSAALPSASTSRDVELPEVMASMVAAIPALSFYRNKQMEDIFKGETTSMSNN